MLLGCGRSDTEEATTHAPTVAPNRDAAVASSPSEGVTASDETTAAAVSAVGRAGLHDAIVTVESPQRQRQTLRDDPRSDGWQSEVISDSASSQLKAIARLLEQGGGAEPGLFAELLEEDFQCGPLWSSGLRNVYRDGELVVFRGEAEPTDDAGPSTSLYKGPTGFQQALKQLLETFGEASELHVKFKLFKVEQTETHLRTKVYYGANAQTVWGSLQQKSVWECHWVDYVDEPPRLLSIRVSGHEQVASGGEQPHLFSDCTEAVIGHNRCFREQLMYGTEHWLRRIESILGASAFGHNGIAIGDVNKDGLEDVYLCQPGGLPDRLFVQNPDATATDVAAKAGVDNMQRTHGALLIDLDADTYDDLIVVTASSLVVFANDGKGKFSPSFVTRAGGTYSISAADFDGDGDLDIYACRYTDETELVGMAGHSINAIPYHDANNGARNILLRNEGDWKFTDATSDVGLNHNNHRWSFAAAWEDYDNDGDQDLYVANDFGRNNLYRNDYGHFTDVAAEAGVEDIGAGMSATWGDYNGDGWMDLYVSNMFSAAGNRIAFQQGFQQNADDATKADIQRHARGNSLFLNNGDGTFRDVSEDAGVTMGRWAWASKFVDFNNDSWQDIFVANGFVTNEDTKDL